MIVAAAAAAAPVVGIGSGKLGFADCLAKSWTGRGCMDSK